MMISSSADADAVFLPEWFVPSEKDVICAWARQNHRHGGNQRFRELIEYSVPLYVAARTKLEKTQVIASVVDKVRRESPGGGFVKRDFHTGLWFEIGDDKARDKVGHAIRRAVEEMGKKKKGSKSKQAIKESDKTKTKGDLSESLGMVAKGRGHQSDKHRGVGGKLGSPRANPRTLQDVTDSLVVPPFLYQPASQSTLESTQTRPVPNFAHSMQQSLAVPPAANLLSQTGAPSFDLFSRMGNEDLFANSSFAAQMKDASPFSNQFSNPSSQQAINLMNQINAVRDGSISGAPFSNQLHLNRFGQFGTGMNELNHVGDSSFLQSNQLGNNTLLSGLSNQINSMQAQGNNSLQQFASLSSQVGQDAESRSLNGGLLGASTGVSNPMHPMLAADILSDNSAPFLGSAGSHFHQQHNSNSGI